MPTSRQMHRLVTHPRDYVRFLQTGKLPQATRPQGPLVDLLRSLGPHDLQAIHGVTVDQRLGYTGSRMFANALQAQRWVAPSHEVFGAFPAESWRDKRFCRTLYLDELLACCSAFPEGLLSRYARLRQPQR